MKFKIGDKVVVNKDIPEFSLKKGGMGVIIDKTYCLYHVEFKDLNFKYWLTNGGLSLVEETTEPNPQNSLDAVKIETEESTQEVKVITSFTKNGDVIMSANSQYFINTPNGVIELIERV